MGELYDELCHHGILGQKWGVRRYQNADGSLTPAGKERYGMSKKEVNSAVKTAKRNYRKTEEPATFTSTTGKNWKNVYEENKQAVESDRKAKAYKMQRDLYYNKAERTEDYDLQEKYQNLGDEAASNYSKRSAEIGKSFSDKYSEALLKDIGYSDLELGKEMLKEYGITNERGKYRQ